MTLSLTVNGTAHVLDEDMAQVKLIDFLHDELDLTGTKFCCGIGVCRACTVAVRRGATPVRDPAIACSTPLDLLRDTEITTVEGVAEGGALHPLQMAFLEHYSFQCGYCAPGFLMGALSFLDRLAIAPIPPENLDAAIATAMESHICRCTGYKRYLTAIREVALETMSGGTRP